MSKDKKVLVCITPQTNSKRLIIKGSELAKSIEGSLHILHVEKGDSIFHNEESAELLQELFNFGSELGGIVHAVCGDNVPKTLKRFINNNKITHIILGATLESKDEVNTKMRKLMPKLSVTILEREQPKNTEDENG